MSPVARNDEDTWASDDQDAPEGSSSKQRQLQRHSTPASPAIPSTADSESALDDDLRRQQEVTESSEAAALNKTGWLYLRTTARNLTSVLRNVGVTGLRVRQLYDYYYAGPWKIHAFLLLYKWKPDRGDRTKWNPSTPTTDNRFSYQEDDSAYVNQDKFIFCSQTLDNSSATQALIASLLNIKESGGNEQTCVNTQEGEIHGIENKFDVGDNIRLLKAFVKPMDAVLGGASVCSSQAVRDAHNQASRDQLGGHPNVLDEDGKLRSSLLAEELWMYSVVLPTEQHTSVYELEGISDGPRLIGTCAEDDCWMDVAMNEVERQINVFREHHTPFLLFSVTSDIKPNNNQLSKRRRIVNMMSDESGNQEDMQNTNDEMDDQNLENGKSSNGDSEESEEEITKEEVERIRATHNYETFFVEMMKLMASRGDIQALIRNDESGAAAGSDDWVERKY